MGSILHITSQLNPARSYLHPPVVFRLIERGEPVPLGERGERKCAVPHAITIVEEDERGDGRDPAFTLDASHRALPELAQDTWSAVQGRIKARQTSAPQSASDHHNRGRGRGRQSHSKATTRTPARRVLASPGKASAWW